MPLPKDLAHKYLPNLGDLYEVGLINVGRSVTVCTLGANTSLTDAQLIAAPPNTAGGNACGPIVHSLGVAPTAVIFQMAQAAAEIAQGLVYGVGVVVATMDNSAVYARAKSFTGTVPAGVGFRMIAIR